MTKKDYILIAAVVNRVFTEMKERKYSVNEVETLHSVMKYLGEMLYKDNNDFNYDKFVIACLR